MAARRRQATNAAGRCRSTPVASRQALSGDCRSRQPRDAGPPRETRSDAFLDSGTNYGARAERARTGDAGDGRGLARPLRCVSRPNHVLGGRNPRNVDAKLDIFEPPELRVVLDRAIADSEANGFVKVLTVPKKDKILGVTIVGEHSGDLIAEFVLAMKHGLGLNKVLGTIHIYPTMAEANKYVAGVWKRQHQPEVLLKWVERYHAWRRG